MVYATRAIIMSESRTMQYMRPLVEKGPIVLVQSRTRTKGPPRGQCIEPSQETLWPRLVAPTGTNRHRRVSTSVAGVFVFFKGGRGFGVFGGLI